MRFIQMHQALHRNDMIITLFIMTGGGGDQLGDGGGGSCLEEERAQRVSFQQSQRADHDYQTRQLGL